MKNNMQEATREQKHIRIDPKKRRVAWKWKEIWRYRDLIFLLTRKTFKLQYKQTILGPLWSVIYPIASSIVMTIVFGRIAKIDTAGIPHILFYLLSNALWSFFSACVHANARTFLDNAYLFGKVYFPRMTVPISNALYHAIGLAIQLVVLIPFSIFFLSRGRISPHYEGIALVPFFVLELALLGIGTGIIISSATTKYRDLMILVNVGVSLWMYLSPIIYPISQIKNPLLHTVLQINPVSAPIEWIRWILLGKGDLSLISLAGSAVLSVAVFLLGMYVFNRVEKTFMDTV